MDKFKALKIILFVFLFSFVFAPAHAFAQRETVPLQEADLYPGGSARGVTIAPGGSIFVLDADDEIWKVDPDTGDYFGYHGISGYELSDLSPQDDELVWWTDNSDMFGSLNTTNGQVSTWDPVDENDDYWGNLPQFGPLFYDNGTLWLSEWMGTSFGFLRFNISTDEICSYDVPIHASDFLLDGDYLWALDWFLDALLRLDPVAGQLVKYATGRSIGMDANLQADGELLWWAEDVGGGDIVSFDPDILEMTVYDLPDTERPRNSSVFEGKVWYTDANGGVGRLDPSLFSSAKSTLTQVVLKSSSTLICKNLGPGVISSAMLDTDTTLQWTSNNSTRSEIDTGLVYFSLPEGAEPFGIAGTSTDIWIADPGRQKLIRMPVSDPAFAYSNYLPLIVR